ncbi:Uncharacterised protein [Achromobacter sp. 2789STDY5608633]|jgi:hypothetical protein|nr:Uncharacterised protein [Achromobacter sp. 2789STDY5608633]
MTSLAAHSSDQRPFILVLDPPGLMGKRPRDHIPFAGDIPRDALNPFLQDLPSTASQHCERRLKKAALVPSD